MMTTTLFMQCKKTELKCPRQNLTIDFIGFNSGELDSLTAFRFERNGNFDQLVDSVAVINLYPKQYSLGDTVSVSLPNILIDREIQSSSDYFDVHYDVLVVNKKLNDSTYYTDIQYSDETQLVRRPAFEHEACVSPIISFKMNDTTVVVNRFEKIYIKK